MLTFGERLRMARDRKGLSQVDVFRLINLNNRSLSRYENNTTSPDPDTIKALVELYDVSPAFILGLSDEMGRARPSAGTSEAMPRVAESLADGDRDLVETLEKLSPEAKEKAADYLKMLKQLEQMSCTTNVADFKENV